MKGIKQKFIIITGLSLLMSSGLVACQKPTDKAQTQPPNQPIEEIAIIEEKPKGDPVVYPFADWQKQTGVNVSIQDIESIKTALGAVNRTDEQRSIDFSGKLAVKYSFQPESAPYLDLIDSPQFIELGWYYANPSDTDDEKRQSIENTGKIYKIAKGLFAKEGEELVEDIVNKQVIKQKTINNIYVEVAKCEFFSCMIVIKK